MDALSTAPSNAHEFSVSELAFSLKRTVEETYGRVRVRGELGRVTIAKSGHMYADIKDDKAVISSIMWKGSVSRLSVRPEEGMEVVVEGKLSTYPGRSQYQLIIDKLEPAGEGALMALLERRKKQFASEGLFDAERKKTLPFLPRSIGVVTSPTGAVIRDILHRISDRFPVHVIVWPVLVQGDRAAAQITEAIDGFNALPEFDEGSPNSLSRPDVLIIARGGGSIEDLWCFNEENVVRAAAASTIALISAVGHETDWTLIDYVSDERAPTPTGAAEIAVPVRHEYMDTVQDYGMRLRRGLSQTVERKSLGLLAAKLPKLDTVLSAPRQRLDLASAKLGPALRAAQNGYQNRLQILGARLPRLESILAPAAQKLGALSDRMAPALNNNLRTHYNRASQIGGRLRVDMVAKNIQSQGQSLDQLASRSKRAYGQMIERAGAKLARSATMLEALSYQKTLQRGFALVSDVNGNLVRSAEALSANDRVVLGFGDGKVGAVIGDVDFVPDTQSSMRAASIKSAAKKPTKKKSTNINDEKQPDLF